MIVTGKDLKAIALLWAYPELKQLPPADWAEALKRARETSFDAIEWIGVLAGIVFVTYVLQFYAGGLPVPARYVVQFLVAIPLLALLVGPFYLRRTRRGLDMEVRHRHGPGHPNLPG